MAQNPSESLRSDRRVLSRRPFGDPRRKGRSIPSDLPGAGSIFQPLGDTRRS